MLITMVIKTLHYPLGENSAIFIIKKNICFPKKRELRRKYKIY